MIGILFECKECSNHVSVQGSSVGRIFNCPECGSEVQAPEPVVVFFCPSCFRQYSAPSGLRGKDYLCPNCEAKIHIPDVSTLRCGACAVNVELEDDVYAEYERKSVACPECESNIQVPRRPRIEEGDDGDTQSGDLPRGFAHKTLRLDDIIAGIPQAARLKEGHCPFCGREVRQVDEKSFACESCGRLIHTVTPEVRRAP